MSRSFVGSATADAPRARAPTCTAEIAANGTNPHHQREGGADAAPRRATDGEVIAPS